jgi:hypothetical protein
MNDWRRALVFRGVFYLTRKEGGEWKAVEVRLIYRPKGKARAVRSQRRVMAGRERGDVKGEPPAYYRDTPRVVKQQVG